jgi:hypothetical protein
MVLVVVANAVIYVWLTSDIPYIASGNTTSANSCVRSVRKEGLRRGGAVTAVPCTTPTMHAFVRNQHEAVANTIVPVPVASLLVATSDCGRRRQSAASSLLGMSRGDGRRRTARTAMHLLQPIHCTEARQHPADPAPSCPGRHRAGLPTATRPARGWTDPSRPAPSRVFHRRT